MQNIIYVHKFSKNPCGLIESDSNTCAKIFKEQILLPKLALGKLVVDFDNLEGISSSWMCGVFSKIKELYNLGYLKKNLYIKCDEDSSISLEIWSYIDNY